jgi:hypothetical protein
MPHAAASLVASPISMDTDVRKHAPLPDPDSANASYEQRCRGRMEDIHLLRSTLNELQKGIIASYHETRLDQACGRLETGCHHRLTAEGLGSCRPHSRACQQTCATTGASALSTCDCTVCMYMVTRMRKFPLLRMHANHNHLAANHCSTVLMCSLDTVDAACCPAWQALRVSHSWDHSGYNV